MPVGHNISLRVGDGPEMEYVAEHHMCWWHKRNPRSVVATCGCTITGSWRPKAKKSDQLDAFAEHQLLAVAGNAD